MVLSRKPAVIAKAFDIDQKVRKFLGEPIVLDSLLDNVKFLAVLEKNFSTVGAAGALFSEIAAVFINEKNRPQFFQFIAGLGGRDFFQKKVTEIFEKMKTGKQKKSAEGDWIGLRG